MRIRKIFSPLGRFVFFTSLLLSVAHAGFGQSFSYVSGNLSVNIDVFNPCPGEGGGIRFTINSTEGGVNASIAVLGPVNLFPPQSVAQGSSFMFNPATTLPAGTYNWIIGDGTNTIGSLALPALPAFLLTSITLPTLTKDIETNNSSCITPDGQVQASITGGSKVLAGGGSFTYTWSSSNGTVMPPTAITDGNTPLNLATLLSVSGLRGGTYTLQVFDNYSFCSSTVLFTITDPSPSVFNITTPSPINICTGDNITITLDNSESGVTYEILRGLASLPTPITFPGTGVGPFVMTFPSTQFANGNVIQVKASNGFCTTVLMVGTGLGNVNLTINPLPTIVGVSVTPVCEGSLSTNLIYTSTTGTPNQYSIDFDVTAQGQGFVDVVNAALTASPIVVTIPGAALAGVYNATLTVRNSLTGCVSSSQAITVTINPNPTITLSTNPSVCTGTTTGNLLYTTTTGSPDQYSIDFDVTAQGQGFVDVVNAALTASPIAVTIPGAALAGVYNATFTVRNSLTGCVSSSQAITVTISPNPTITLSTNPSVCAGTTTGNLLYTATTGSPDQYSIDFDVTAQGQGFVDVVNAALTASPIVVTIPGAALAGVYNATLTVRNSLTGCVSGSSAITVTIIASPTITLSTNPSVCAGTTTGNLLYTATTGTPNQYSIDFDVTAQGQGFVDVVNAALTASPIVVTIPGAALAGVYNATFTVRNSLTGCLSSSQAITVTINPNPTITLSTNPSVCTGTTTGNLLYTATTGSPDQYSIDFDVTAQGQGFVDVVNAALTASPIAVTIPGAALASVYNATITVRNSLTGCVSSSQAITVTINPNPTITLSTNPSVCAGTTTGNLLYTATTGSPDQYSIDFDVTAQGQGFVDVVNAALTASPVVVNIPGAALAGVYNATLTVRNSLTGCVSGSQAITVTIIVSPTITLSTNPSVCAGTTTGNLLYTSTTGTPDQYSIDFDVTAQGQGFVDVVNAALTASPIVVTIPGAALGGIYNATLTVSNTLTGCLSSSQAITVTINPSPTITLSTNPSVCTGTTTGNLLYTATTGSPDQYSIDFDVTAQGQGFVDVVNAALTASPIVVTIPGAALGGIYNATLTVSNTLTGCLSSSQAITVTISPNPTITLSTNPSVCTGTTTGNLLYTATTGSPDQYSIDFDVTAQGQGFVDVVNAALTASPIVVTIPGAALAGIYNATLIVRNSLTGCVSGSSAITVTIIASPTITLSTNPSVCSGTTTGNLLYTSTTGTPDQYSIDFDVTAQGQGFVDVVNAALTASPIVVTIPGAALGGIYNATLTVSNTLTGCLSSSQAITVTINPNPTITLSTNPSVCTGTTTGNLLYTATTGSPDQYSIDFDVTAQGQGFVDVVNAALTASPIVVTIPGAALGGIYNATLTVSNTLTGCLSSSQAITVTINPNPTITLSTNPSVCTGTTTGNLLYTATTGSPDQYSIDFDVTAQGQGFVDVVNAALTASPIVVTIPGAALGGIYNATLTVSNTLTGCLSGSQAITVTIIVSPTITLSTNPSVCTGTTTGNLLYTATNGSPDQYSIDFDVTAQGQGFVDVVNAALTASPIVVTIPGAALAGVYNATLTVSNSLAGCVSVFQPISVTINPVPLPTLSGSASLCSGAANVIYTTEVGQSNYAWSVSAGGVITAGGSPTDNTVTVTWITAGPQNVSVNYSSLGCSAALPTSLPVTVNALPTATLTGSNTICIGASSTLTFTLTGVGPWNVIYSDGTTNFPIAFATSPGTVSVFPIAPTTYSLVSVSDAQCGAGTTSGTAVVTVNPIPVAPTPGVDTWIGEVFTDAGPPITAADFAPSKYRGFIDETDIASLGFSSYNTVTDAFNLNLSNFVPMAGPNVCGSFLDRFSVRYKMTKTLPVGIYTFTVGADDGVRLLVDGVNVITPAAFGPHAYQVYTATVCITAGSHNFEIEYFEAGGFSRVSFDYQLAPAPIAPTPVSVCVGSAAPTLTVSSADPGVLSFRWYTDAALTNLIAGITPPGSSFTPAPVELDMSVVGSTDFFVTAVYACGEGQAAQVTVDVVNGATITLPTPPVQICQTGGVIDLTTLVSALPGSGNFTFAGTGVTTSPNFDPTLVAVSTSILVDYTVGTCVAPQQILVIDVINTATVTVPVADIDICQSSGLQDLTLLVSATPLLGTYTFTGAGVTGTDFDPSAQSGLIPIQVDYNVGGPGGCSDSKTFNFNVTTNAVLTVDNTTDICPSAADVDLRTLVTAVPAGGTFTFVGTDVTGNFFDPSGSAGSTVSIQIFYDQGGCAAVSTVQIAVKSVAACGGGGSGDCSLLTTIQITPTLPTCSAPDGGELVFTFGGLSYEVILEELGDPLSGQTERGNVVSFDQLTAGTYLYTIRDLNIPANTCVNQSIYRLDAFTQVNIDSAYQISDATCFGGSDGNLKLAVNGTTTGKYFFTYVNNGIESSPLQFTPGALLPIGLPANDTDFIIIKVDETAALSCPDTVMVRISYINPEIFATITTTPATCNNNDGGITISNVSGGSGTNNFDYSVDGGLSFQDPLTFPNLPGGSYSIIVRDKTSGCEQPFTGDVTFPGFVNFTATPSPATCTNYGLSGSILVQIPVGSGYKVALSIDPNNEPAASEYLDYNPPSIIFDNLATGTYYIYVQSQTASCPTRSAAISVNGVIAVNFDINPVCDNNEVSLILDNMTGTVSFGELRYELVVYDKLFPGVIVTPGGIRPTLIVDPTVASTRLDYNTPEFAFLQTPNVEYLISLYQIEPNLGCDIYSPTKNYTTTRPVFARADPTKTFESYPDVPNGKMSIIDFDGGLIPYEIRIELDSASVIGQTFQTNFAEVEKNSNLEYEQDYENIPAGRYLVQVADTLGCTYEFDVRVPLDTDLFIPNIFTPNGDADNAVFFIRNLDITDANKLVITDRWGMQVLSTNSYQNDWTGDGLSDGIYYYTLQTPTETKKGWVEILRGSKP